ncbi:ABC transporter ATP-binding protein [Candidatus Methanodesulfokora washburnensis]|jgi:branched-chain amino acid transport system ATP-binding protein|uniref:ABC transporter ATP-binding protein n=1 Tax=Candidatus Methanodesulfokora washburnensis TaxID=2478471 RepID=A0A429GHZ9_9CREN|nr:ABC transporter ATP-binding protein [Candidatus Methanodesulfokores washburnensis]RSN73396.1 ABC transporter ATP-binding protein [Candidatus Methanodesulfokores washburnensis]
MLSIENLFVYYGKAIAVRDISLNINKGEIVILIGPNGAGKTSTLRAIMGLNKEINGKIYFKGNEISKLSTAARVKLGINMVPEGGHPFPYLTVEENLLVGGFLMPKNKIEENLDYIYNLFPRLKERKKQLAGTLSGGERRMLAIGRALMTNPELLMIDELSLGLAPVITENLFKSITKLREEGMTIFLVEQNAKRSLEIADRGYVIENGTIVLEGSREEMIKNEYLRKAYLAL